MPRILIIEDEPAMATILKETLEVYAYKVAAAFDGKEGFKIAVASKPHLIILDLMLPEMNGFDFLQQFRKINLSTPVIILTAKTQTISIIQAYEFGCNDYLRKPFAMDELLARMKFHLRSKAEAKTPLESSQEIFTIGQYLFNAITQELRHGLVTVQLSYKEVEILKKLCLQQNRIVERKNILLELWGDDTVFNASTLNVYITKLRNHLKLDQNIRIISIRFIGYKLVVKT